MSYSLNLSTKGFWNITQNNNNKELHRSIVDDVALFVRLVVLKVIFSSQKSDLSAIWYFSGGKHEFSGEPGTFSGAIHGFSGELSTFSGAKHEFSVKPSTFSGGKHGFSVEPSTFSGGKHEFSGELHF
ncbi:hypothetical protein [Lysinibacillus sp. NPDC093216]|uniref:hypothetical protein n=1 Tax=Lysinibacillus sp. NPDC093216 TaxID=3390576 RepID=UPI003D07C361